MPDQQEITIGHSPDADDAFMFYALASKAVTIPGREIRHVVEEIEALNRRALTAELDVTAVSAAQYPHVAGSYRIMSCGASVGRNYGPMVVSRYPLDFSDLGGKRIAVPGKFTTSWMLFQIFVDADVEPVFLGFDEVTQAVLDGNVDAAILLHEGQILYERQGLFKVVDLGERWFDSTNLPIPLGLDLVNRRIDQMEAQNVADALRGSIVYARANEEDALDYALGYGRGINRDDGRRFIRMYVNDDTVDMGSHGYRALDVLYRMAHHHGIIPKLPDLDILQAKTIVW